MVKRIKSVINFVLLSKCRSKAVKFAKWWVSYKIHHDPIFAEIDEKWIIKAKLGLTFVLCNSNILLILFFVAYLQFIYTFSSPSVVFYLDIKRLTDIACN